MGKRLLPVLFVGLVLLSGTALAKSASHTVTELKYAEGLFQLGLPDFANMVLDQLETNPDAAVRLKQFQFRLATKEGLKQAEKEVAGEPADATETWHMKLALADGYYAWGKHAKAFDIYNAFIKRFNQTQDADERKILTEVIHRYAQMLGIVGQLKESLAAYRRVDLEKVERPVKRQLLAEQAELMLRICEQCAKVERTKHLAAAEKICDDLMLVQDLWGGKAIVAKAHILLLRGEPKKAEEMLKTSLPTLIELDRRLQEETAR